MFMKYSDEYSEQIHIFIFFQVLENHKKHFCIQNGYNATVIDVLKDGTLLLTFVESMLNYIRLL